jgi:O-acetyl-ADP-ribose deacetylase (regulator of RNase III)
MGKRITYKIGDATAPQVAGVKIIAHICNDLGGWGKGFVLAISKRWSEPEREYRLWYRVNEGFTLGAVQFVQVSKDIYVANMIGQRGIKTGINGPPIRYDAVEKCLLKVLRMAIELNASVHMPRIGCGLAGGTWAKIEPLIRKTLGANDIKTFVYDLP